MRLDDVLLCGWTTFCLSTICCWGLGWSPLICGVNQPGLTPHGVHNPQLPTASTPRYSPRRPHPPNSPRRPHSLNPHSVHTPYFPRLPHCLLPMGPTPPNSPRCPHPQLPTASTQPHSPQRPHPDTPHCVHTAYCPRRPHSPHGIHPASLPTGPPRPLVDGSGGHATPFICMERLCIQPHAGLCLHHGEAPGPEGLTHSPFP